MQRFALDVIVATVVVATDVVATVVVVLCTVLIIGHKVRILLHFHSAAVAINLQGAFLAAVDVHVVPSVLVVALLFVVCAVVVVFEIFTQHERQHSGRWINTVIAEA